MLLITKNDFCAEMASSQDKDVIRECVSKYGALIDPMEIIIGKEFARRIEDFWTVMKKQEMDSDTKYAVTILKSFSAPSTDEAELAGTEIGCWLEKKQQEIFNLKTIRDMQPESKSVSSAGGVTVSFMEKIPAGENCFRHDLFHMGTPINENMMIMHKGEADSYIIVCFPRTGQRVKIDFDLSLVGEACPKCKKRLVDLKKQDGFCKYCKEDDDSEIS